MAWNWNDFLLQLLGVGSIVFIIVAGALLRLPKKQR